MEFISISIVITDDDVEQEPVETYLASFTIISSVGNVQKGDINTTSINILNDDGKL